MRLKNIAFFKIHFCFEKENVFFFYWNFHLRRFDLWMACCKQSPEEENHKRIEKEIRLEKRSQKKKIKILLLGNNCLLFTLEMYNLRCGWQWKNNNISANEGLSIGLLQHWSLHRQLLYGGGYQDNERPKFRRLVFQSKFRFFCLILNTI